MAIAYLKARNLCLMSEIAEEVTNEKAKTFLFRQPRCRLASPLWEIPSNIRAILIRLETRIIRIHSPRRL